MLEKISMNWWKFALRGMIAIIFGIVALINPHQTLQALVLVFGAYVLFDGFLAAIAGISFAPYFDRWWALLLEGVAGMLIGLTTIFMPGIAGRAFLYLIATWGVITGVFEIVAAIQFRTVLKGEWMLIFNGLLSILFGILLFVYPVVGAISVIWVIGIYAIVFGGWEIIFAFRLHNLQQNFEIASATNV